VLPTTFQALAVTLIALVPGAFYMFAYERVAGSYGVTLADRFTRFIAASVAFQAIFSGPTLLLYRDYVVTHRLQYGQVNWLLFELTAVGYSLIPVAVGSLVGHGQRNHRPWAQMLVGESPEPRAWDHVWHRKINAIIRLKLKSGIWLAGAYITAASGQRSYASGYPEEGDLFLVQAVEVDPDNGRFISDSSGDMKFIEPRSGLLVHWSDVEYLVIQEI
jgi:hypothetical protein